MKDIAKFIFWNGLPVWVMIIGGMMLVFGGVNDVRAYSIFDAIAQTWDSAWTVAGAIITAAGFIYAIVAIGFAIYNSIKR